MNFAGIAVFAVTYVLVSARRIGRLGLDRPAAALLGAVACVALDVLTPGDALRAVDASTLLLLFGVMGMGAFLVVDDFFTHVEGRLTAWAASPARLLGHRHVLGPWHPPLTTLVGTLDRCPSV